MCVCVCITKLSQFYEGRNRGKRRKSSFSPVLPEFETQIVNLSFRYNRIASTALLRENTFKFRVICFELSPLLVMQVCIYACCVSIASTKQGNMHHYATSYRTSCLIVSKNVTIVSIAYDSNSLLPRDSYIRQREYRSYKRLFVAYELFLRITRLCNRKIVPYVIKCITLNELVYYLGTIYNAEIEQLYVYTSVSLEFQMTKF